MQRQLKQILTEQGFSLMEVLIVMAILAIVVAISMPNMKTWQIRSRVNGDARNVLSILQHARFEAVKRNEFISVVFTNDNTDAVDAPDYRVFLDPDADRTLDAGEKTILLEDLNFANHAASFTGGTASAIFNSRGMPSSSAISANFIIGNVAVDSPDGTYSKSVVVSPSGRIRIE